MQAERVVTKHGPLPEGRPMTVDGDLLGDVTPTAALVALVLATAEEPLSLDDLADRTGRSKRAIRAAKDQLRAHDCVHQRPDYSDARKIVLEFDSDALERDVPQPD